MASSQQEKKNKSQVRNWIFTINNYTSEPVFHTDMKYLIYGFEIAPTTGTPHLQGYVQFEKVKRMTEAHKYFTGAALFVAPRTPLAASDYCKKTDRGGTGDYREFGTLCTQGKRSDLESLKESIKDGERNPKRLRDLHMAAYKFPAVMQQMLIDYRPVPASPDILLKPWQEELYATVRVRALVSDRTIHFIVDPTGGGGKSTFCNYLESALGSVVQVMKPGKYEHMAYELDDSIHILLMDTPRSRSDVLQYHFLEDVKDGRVSNSKYQSYQKRLGPVHVVVMCNEHPDLAKLSVDRFNIVTI